MSSPCVTFDLTCGKGVTELQNLTNLCLSSFAESHKMQQMNFDVSPKQITMGHTTVLMCVRSDLHEVNRKQGKTSVDRLCSAVLGTVNVLPWVQFPTSSGFSHGQLKTIERKVKYVRISYQVHIYAALTYYYGSPSGQ